MNRIEICKDNFKKLFKGEALNGKGNDPEMMDILQMRFLPNVTYNCH